MAEDETKNKHEKCSKVICRFLAGENVANEVWVKKADGARKILIQYQSEEAAEKYVTKNKGERPLGEGLTSMIIRTAPDIRTFLDTRLEIKQISECGVSRLCNAVDDSSN